MANTTHITTLRPDAKGRITLGALAEGISSFQVHREEGSGRLMLEPMAEIPARERWLYQNPEALAMLREGIRQVAAGQSVPLGDFSQYANDTLD